MQITHYMKIMRFFYAFIHPVRHRIHKHSNNHDFLKFTNFIQAKYRVMQS